MRVGDLVRVWKPGYGDHGRLGVIISHGLGTGIFTVAIPHPVNTLKVVEYDHWYLEKVNET